MDTQLKLWRTAERALCTFVALIATSIPALTEAATLSVYQSNGGHALSFFLRGETLNNGFNGVELLITGSGFENLTSGLVAGVPRPAGHPFTYRNRVLGLDPLEPDLSGAGRDWSILDPIQSATVVSFFGGPLRKTISTAGEPRGELFLANVFTSQPPTFGRLEATLTLFNSNDAEIVFRQFFNPHFDLPELPEVPEPNSATLLTVALWGLAVACRTRSKLRSRFSPVAASPPPRPRRQWRSLTRTSPMLST